MQLMGQHYPQFNSDATNGSFIQSGTGTGANIPWLVYGRMPSRQNVGAGNYTDNVTVTIEW